MKKIPVSEEFIGHKAGMQRKIADLEPEDLAILITRSKGHLEVFGCGADTAATSALGMLSYAQQVVFHAADADDEA